MTVEARIRRDIEARIHSGEWRPGHRIPFEHELVATYGCARATVSKALGGLAKDGLIERRRKAGSFVAHPQVHSAVLEVPDLAQVIAARGEGRDVQEEGKCRLCVLRASACRRPSAQPWKGLSRCPSTSGCRNSRFSKCAIL